MLLLTWHGTIVCLRAGGGGLVHAKLPLTEPDAAPLDVDVSERRPEGSRQTSPALGIIAVHGSQDGRVVSLNRYGRFLCAEAHTPRMAFDRPEAHPWETFLPLAAQDLAFLTHLLSQRWIRQSSRRVLRRSEIQLVAGRTLHIGADRVELARILPWPEAPGERVSLPSPDGTVELVLARPEGSALVRNAQWAVRARRTAQTLALAVHRQLAGQEPEQAELEQDVAFLLERGPAGLEDLIERKRPAATEAAPPPETGTGWPAIAQPVVALGTGCIVAYTLRRIGLDQPPMPFDWLATTPAMVRHCLQTDFLVLLDRSQYSSLTGQGGEGEPEDGCAHAFYAREYGIARVFNDSDPTREADYRDTEACVGRFRDVLASPEAKLFVQVAPVAPGSGDEFAALATLLDERTANATLLHVAVQPPDPGLAVPLLSAVSRRGGHTLYELQPISRMDGEGFGDAADAELLARTIAAHAAAPEKIAAAPVKGLRDAMADAERNRLRHSVLTGWAMREMAHWHRSPVSKDAAARRFGALNANARWACLFHFAGGSVRLEDKPAEAAPDDLQKDRAQRYLRFFESVAPMLPDDFETTICVGVGDKVTSKESVPVFGFQKEIGASTILLPDIDLLNNDFYEAPGYEDARSYTSKTREAVFAGGTTGGLITPEIARSLSLPRLRAAAYFTGSPDVDFRLPDIVQCTTPQAEAILREQPFCQTEYMPWSEQLVRRFIISMDGNGATCSRVAIALLSSSVLLKYESNDVLHYFSGLQPWQHFVPVREDGDVAWIMAQEALAPEVFERIAMNGRDFARSYLSRSSAQLYTAMLLKLYAASLSGEAVGPLRPAPRPMAAVRRRTPDTHVVCHVQQRGDMTTRADGWNGLPGSTLAIEGFALFLGPDLAGAAITWQAVLADGTLSEAAEPGGFVGTRGANRPILGLCITAAATGSVPVEVVCHARFVDGTVIGPVLGGTVCQTASKAPLEAFRLTITRL